MKTQTITVAKFIDQQITQGEKLQEDIAVECGFANSNIISMIKNGTTKLPLAKVGVMARALGVDPAYLLRLTMTEYMPEVWSVMESIFGRSSFVTESELDLLALMRQRAQGLTMAPRRFVWNETFTMTAGSRARWACGQVAWRPVHMPTGRS